MSGTSPPAMNTLNTLRKPAVTGVAVAPARFLVDSGPQLVVRAGGRPWLRAAADPFPNLGLFLELAGRCRAGRLA